TNEKWGFLGNVTWLPDMTGLIVIGSAAEDLHGTHQLWLLSYPQGSRRPITNDLFDYRTISLTANGKSLVSVAADQTSAVWSVPRERDWAMARINRDGSDLRILCSVIPVGRSGSIATFTPDGRSVVFDSAIGGVDRLWRVSIDGGQPVALPFENVFAASVSPDGKSIAYGAVDKIYVAPMSGG